MNRSRTHCIFLITAVALLAVIFYSAYFRRETQEDTARQQAEHVPVIIKQRHPGPVAESSQQEIKNVQLFLIDRELKNLDKKLEAEAELYLSSMDREDENLDEAISSKYISAWTISRAPNAINSVKLSEKIKEYESVQVDENTISMVAVGDIVLVRLPGTGEYPVLVTAVSIQHNGETSWNGYLAEYEVDYPVTFTLGAYSSYATIATPEGLYSMEAIHGNGWVYRTPDMIDLVDPEQPDYLIADQQHDQSGK